MDLKHIFIPVALLLVALLVTGCISLGQVDESPAPTDEDTGDATPTPEPEQAGCVTSKIHDDTLDYFESEYGIAPTDLLMTQETSPIKILIMATSEITQAEKDLLVANGVSITAGGTLGGHWRYTANTEINRICYLTTQDYVEGIKKSST